ncbi:MULTISPECIES: HU family DNA-binding protein [Actibacterium]|nr:MULTISPECIES: HU family DNA-binding protein [Actibacterium]
MFNMTNSRKTTTTRNISAVADITDATEAEAVVAEEGGEEAVAPNALRKKELIDRVVEVSGMKKKDVKPIVEATLAVLGAALSNEETMNLPPMGKIVINRKKDLANGEVLMTRIRRSTKAAETGEEPLAEVSE